MGLRVQWKWKTVKSEGRVKSQRPSRSVEGGHSGVELGGPWPLGGGAEGGIVTTCPCPARLLPARALQQMPAGRAPATGPMSQAARAALSRDLPVRKKK